MHKKVLEPRRQHLLGYLQAPPHQLAGASQYAFSVTSGERACVVPGAAPLNLSDLPSKTLALVLGGFRGPFLIYMRSEAERQKQEKIHFNLIDYHTKVALLQPDYPEVWVNGSWDLGWNVSAQWSRPEIKYEWIRRAIDFLSVGVRKNPNDVSILTQMGTIYHLKLGHAEESPYYRKWVRRDEGHSTYLIAYEWYDRARKVSRKYGLEHPHFGAPVLNSLACHAVSDYAREFTQRMHDAFSQADKLNSENKIAEAKRSFAEGRKLLAKAITTWDWAKREWEAQVSRFPAPDLPHKKFVSEAEEMHKQLTEFSNSVSLERLTELVPRLTRPKLW